METQVNFIKRIVRTPTAVSYRFTRPSEFLFSAGQYMLVRLGQSDELVHALSFSDGPQQDFLEFTKRMTGSVYCQHLEALRPGDTITVKGPMGCFSAENIADNMVCIAGGIGITPIRSMFSDLAHKGNRRRIILLYGNLHEEDIAFGEELDALDLPCLRIVHVLQQPGSPLAAHTGFINAEIIRTETKAPTSSTFLVSGPPMMVTAMEEQLAMLDITGEQIRTDRFLGYT